jgi:hypothetical protein
VSVLDFIARADRLQHGRVFKIVASVIVLACALGAIGAYAVSVQSLRASLPEMSVPEAPAETPAGERGGEQGKSDGPATDPNTAATAKALRESAQAIATTVNSILQRRLSVTGVAVGVGVGAGVALAAVWLGLGLTYSAIVVLGAALAGPLWAVGTPGARSWALFIGGSLVLAAAFAALVQGLKAVLSASHPVTSIARNVVDEAVRMKISLIFIVMLILSLALLPMALDTGAPLRYRVQAFLAYSLGGTFWITAVMSLFLAAGSVAFEQRDKIIWQTMTKPVAAWQYVLGKWLGVSAVAAILLGVSSTGAFLFTEHLRNQPAQGEVEAYVAEGGQAITPDRLALETQVLTARAALYPTLPAIDRAELDKEIARRVEKLKNEDPYYQATRSAQAGIEQQIFAEYQTALLSIEPASFQTYFFDGLTYAKEANVPITFRFKVNAGTNAPTDTYKLTLFVDNAPPLVLECRLDTFLTQTLAPSAISMVDVPGKPGEKAGQLKLQIFNGDFYQRTANRETVTFPTAGLEVSYPVSGFRGNFLRTAAILWMKISFLSMVAILCATFLSFSVASLTSFGILFAAESVSFLSRALDSWDARGLDGEFLWWRLPTIWITEIVTIVLGFYAKIEPVGPLAAGRLVGWGTVFDAVVIMGLLSAGLMAAASFIFSRRELATYSGQ